MKRLNLLALVALCTSLLAGHATAAEKVPPRVRAEIARIADRAHVPGIAVAKVERGRVAWQAVYGERAPRVPLTLDTVFNVASLTKPVFAAAALALVADDKLGLDEKISADWRDPDVAGDARNELLTPRILLSHQSGFPNWRGDRPLAFMFDPGERHEYSGEGYEYLRRAIEHKTGKSLPELLTDKVLRPAGLQHTSAGWSEAIGANVASGFDESGKVIDTNLATRGPSAAANLMTTVGDYARFAAWVSRGADLPPNLFAQLSRSQAMHRDPGELFGLGWKLVPLGKETALLHDGREPGVRAWVLVQPSTREALVIFTNSSNGELTFRALAEKALKNGHEVMTGTDALVWRYLVHLPAQALMPMSKGIARSPSFLSTLLHSVDTMLIQPSGISRKQKALAAARVDDYVFARLNGRVDAARAEKLVARLLVKEGDSLRLRSSLDAEGAVDWVEALRL